jgi:predicted dinucleotide-utilizing enzyme
VQLNGAVGMSGYGAIGAQRTMITEDDRPKPLELVSLYAATSIVFRTLKEEFQVPDIYELELHDVDAAEPFLRSTVDIAAITMRKIQALRWVAKPGVETTNDIVVTLAADLLRALDHLVQCCNDQANADSLLRFKYQVALAARRAGGDGGIARLR